MCGPVCTLYTLTLKSIIALLLLVDLVTRNRNYSAVEYSYSELLIKVDFPIRFSREVASSVLCNRRKRGFSPPPASLISWIFYWSIGLIDLYFWREAINEYMTLDQIWWQKDNKYSSSRNTRRRITFTILRVMAKITRRKANGHWLRVHTTRKQ